jgi:hypothetical protein
LTCISAGGVPEGAAADCSDDAAAVEAACAGVDTADCVEELPESDVHPATKMPATRIAEATNMMIMLLFMGYVSLTVREASLLMRRIGNRVLGRCGPDPGDFRLNRSSAGSDRTIRPIPPLVMISPWGSSVMSMVTGAFIFEA